MRLIDAQLSLTPSDVTGFLACTHLTTLEVAVARGELTPPVVENDQRDLVFRKGEEHERGYLAQLRADGRDVVEIPDGRWEERVAATEQALRSGADVVYQGAFADGRWRGIADFLLRQPDGTYEALDTKLARHAKPAYILQLCFYNEQLARIQQSEPEQIHVLLGSGELASFRPGEFGAYYRRVRARREEFVDHPRPTEPWPNDHCGVCDFKPTCDAHWDAIDHLSRVAGLTARLCAHRETGTASRTMHRHNVRGGPGTGKSVVAINLVAALSEDGIATLHATGSRAFTENLRKAVGHRAAALFKYFNSFQEAERQELDVLVLDEAHRIRDVSWNWRTPKRMRTDRTQVAELSMRRG